MPGPTTLRRTIAALFLIAVPAAWRTSRDVFWRSFVQNQHEVNYKKSVRFEISPERGEWTRNDGTKERLASPNPLDDLTMLVFIRSLPLKVGDTYSIPRYRTRLFSSKAK